MDGDALRKPGRRADLVFARVQEALASGGCPVCRLSAHAVQRFLDNFLYERVNDPQTRELIQAAWGFCPQHAWMLPSQRHPVLGVAIVYRDLVHNLRARLDALVHRAPGDLPRAFRQTLPRPGSCPACAHRQRMEEVYLASLLEHVREPEVQQALSGPSPLCLPHLLRAASVAPSRQALGRLVELHREALARLERDLSELVRKHDYRFRHEGLSPTEATSWLRALEALSGRDPCGDRSAPDLWPHPPKAARPPQKPPRDSGEPPVLPEGSSGTDSQERP